MGTSHEVGELYPFTRDDLGGEELARGIGHMLGSFESWRDSHPNEIAAHVDDFTGVLREVAGGQGLLRRIGGVLLPGLRGAEKREEELWVRYFGLHNLGEDLKGDEVAYLQARLHEGRMLVDGRQTRRDAKRDTIGTVIRSLETLAPELNGLPEMEWLQRRTERLHRILPENVVQDGGMGKVMRIIMGVMAIAIHDTRNEPFAEQRAHLSRVIPGAYILGSTYALVDDVLQTHAGKVLSLADKEKVHEQISYGLATGEPIQTTDMPEHPLIDELGDVYELLRQYYPYSEYRHLYNAIESMYLAQHREMQLEPEKVMANGGVRELYPDMAIKAAMTRVVANILGRREVPNEVYTKILNSVFISQLRDDFQDVVADRLAGDLTPFTLPYDPNGGANPLYDMFAFTAFRANVIWAGSSNARAALIRHDQGEIAPHIAAHPIPVREMLATYPHSPQISQFASLALDDHKALHPKRFRPRDMRLETVMSRYTSTRDQLSIEPRTFLQDRRAFLDEVIREAVATDSEIGRVADYALEAGGKRLRPALTLMLAESLSVPYDNIKPLLQAVELIHTSSLILDDLPAQDNAQQRRGRPAAHIAFSEANAQLASVAMISRGFGRLAGLGVHFPPERVNEVVAYADKMLGFGGLCEGQMMDLSMESMEESEILKMYALKTSLAISAALVPLMILTGRPQAEIEQMETFAHHAGIVFQLRDDILDVIASAEQLGKDVGNDAGKKNIAQLYGVGRAEELMCNHLRLATESCESLPFDTRLLQGTVNYFATRRK